MSVCGICYNYIDDGLPCDIIHLGYCGCEEWEKEDTEEEDEEIDHIIKEIQEKLF